MPYWAERGGYIEGYRDYEFLFPDGVTPIPIQFAPASSLDGLLIDIENSPKTPQLLTNYLQTLAPGGIGIIHLSTKFWNKKLIYNTLEMSGLEVLYFTKIHRLQYIEYKEGIFKNRFILNAFHFFLRKPNHNFFVIVKKKFYKNSQEKFQFSIIIVLPEDKTKAQKKLELWDSFLKNHKIHNIEMIIIDNFQHQIPEENFSFSCTEWIYHFDNNILENSIYSGIYKSNGKILFLDMNTYEGNPTIFLEILDYFLKNQSNKPFAIYAHYKNLNFLKSLFNYMFSGIKNPFCEYKMLNEKCTEILLKYHPYVLKNKSFLIEKEIKKNKGKILEISIENSIYIKKT